MKKLILFTALVSIFLHLSRQAPDSPPGIDPENYDYPTAEELDSLWREEIEK